MAVKAGVITAVIIGIAVAVLVGRAPKHDMQPTMVKVGGTTIAVEVADSPAERTQGLSGRASLAEGTGLLFDFKEPGDYAIWMKDMRFAIDIVWANEGRVVTVAHDVSPDTFPQAFRSSAPARYVLELPAGTAAAHGIAEGGEFVVQ